MAPVRRTGVGPALRAPGAAEAAQYYLGERTRARYEEAGAADLAHGGCD